MLKEFNFRILFLSEKLYFTKKIIIKFGWLDIFLFQNFFKWSERFKMQMRQDFHLVGLEIKKNYFVAQLALSHA